MANLDNKLLAVIRVRGRVNVRQSISETLDRLHLKRVNSLALIKGTPSNLGMINKVKDYVTYGEISDSELKTLLSAKGVGTAPEASITGMPMKPPRRGYRGIKRSYTNGGDLGYRGEKINELISRMI